MARWFFFVLLLPSVSLAADLGGAWEIQSMGGDRKVDIQQRGKKIIAHRVLWPTFEGKKYKLEHLYRGTISGGSINGELLVKEEEFPDYEILRAFDGKVASNDKISIDGIPMKRTGGGSATPAPAAPPSAPSPPPSTPPPPPSAPSPPPPPPDEPAEPEGTNPGAGLFAAIMASPGMESLFDDALKVAIPEAVAELTSEGDALYGKGDYESALTKYDEASNTGGGKDPQLLQRKGRCLLKLKRWGDAKKVLRSALKLDPRNRDIKRDYKKAKRRAR